MAFSSASFTSSGCFDALLFPSRSWLPEAADPGGAPAAAAEGVPEGSMRVAAICSVGTGSVKQSSTSSETSIAIVDRDTCFLRKS